MRRHRDVIRLRRCNVDRAVDFAHFDVANVPGGPLPLDRRLAALPDRTARSEQRHRQKRIDLTSPAVHTTPCRTGCTLPADNCFSMVVSSQTTLLRIAAFLVDALTMSLVLI